MAVLGGVFGSIVSIELVVDGGGLVQEDLLCVLQGVCVLHGGLFVAACWFVVGGCCVSGSDFAHLPRIVAHKVLLIQKGGAACEAGRQVGFDSFLVV